MKYKDNTINRLLTGRQSPVQLIFMIAGLFAGLMLLLGATQIYFELKGLLNTKNDLLQPQYLVINKEVSLMNTIGLSGSAFSGKEVQEIRDQKDVMNVGEFTAAHFTIHISAPPGFGNFPIGYSDIFLESVPDDFLDIHREDWHWNPESDDLPIVVPDDYLKLYNFGFAPGQHLPQLTRKTIGLAGFNITIEGKGIKKVFHGRIAGFSNRINSILAPQAFMDYANKNYGDNNQNSLPHRLILLSRDPASRSLTQFLDDHHYETNADALKNGRLNSLLNMITSVVISVAFLIILLALLSFIQYAQLIISRSQYEISILILLGYHYRSLAYRYVTWYSRLVLLVLLLSAGCLFFMERFFRNIMEEKGFDITGNIHGEVVVFGLAVCVFIIAIQSVAVYYNIRKTAQFRA